MATLFRERASAGGKLEVEGGDDLDVQLAEAERTRAILDARASEQTPLAEGISLEQVTAEQELQQMLDNDEPAGEIMGDSPATAQVTHHRVMNTPSVPAPRPRGMPSSPPTAEEMIAPVSAPAGAKEKSGADDVWDDLLLSGAAAPEMAPATTTPAARSGVGAPEAPASVEDEKKVEQEIRAEIEKLPPSEREEVALGFENWNLAVKKFKGRVIDRAISAVPGARKIEFIDAWARNFNKEYIAAKRDIERIREEKAAGTYASKSWWGQASNVGYLYGTAAKFARPLLSVAGVVGGLPYQAWMLGALAATRAAEVGAQVSRQRVAASVRGMSAAEADDAAVRLRAIEATSAALPEDAEARKDYELEAHEELPAEYQAAYDEAWQLYEEAREKFEGKGEGASKAALDEVYNAKLPQELKERIALGSETQQRDWLAKRLQRKVAERIGAIAREFDAAQTSEEKDAVVTKHRATLEKYDSLIDSTGRVHVAGARLENLAKAGKVAIAGIAIETGVRGGLALFGALRHWWENVELVPSVEATHVEARAKKAFVLSEPRGAQAPPASAPVEPQVKPTVPPPESAETVAPKLSAPEAVPPKAERPPPGSRLREDTTLLRPEPREGVWQSMTKPVPTVAPPAAEMQSEAATGAEASAAVEKIRAARDVASAEEAEKTIAAMREKVGAVTSPPPERAGLPVKKGDSPLSLAKRLYMDRAAELGYQGDVKDTKALTVWAERASTRHIVGQWLAEHAEDAKEPLAKKIFENGERQELLARWREHGDREALHEIVRDLTVRDFNDILSQKVPNLALEGGRVEIDERGNIFSLGPNSDRLLGNITGKGGGTVQTVAEQAPSPQREVEILGEKRDIGPIMREADTKAHYEAFWERSGFTETPIARSIAEQAGITPAELDQREELLLQFWGKHPELIAHDSHREARHLFEMLSKNPDKLKDQLSFLEHFAYRRESLPEAKQIIRIANVLGERVASSDIYRSVYSHYDVVRHVADTGRQADILELFFSHGASKTALERLTLGWNRNLFRNISAALNDDLDLRVRFSVRDNVEPVNLILYRSGRIAVNGHGVDGNWPARRFKANALPLTEDTLREALAFLNRSDGNGAVLVAPERHEEGGD